MIIAASSTYGVIVKCRGRTAGRLVDWHFDDRNWSIRYLVVRVGRWPACRDVLLSPSRIGQVDWAAGEVHCWLSIMQLHWAPRLEANPPVALQRKRHAAKLLAWESYWTGVLDRQGEPEDPHTRNTRAVTGHRVYGVDGRAGYVDNFIIDDQMWDVRYLVASLGSRRSRRKVVIEPRWVDGICWDDRRVSSRLPAAQIERLPRFHPLEI